MCSMALKPSPNHAEYLAALQKMTPEEKLRRVFELSEFTRQMFRAGLRERFPDLAEAELHRLFLDRLAKCHNRNY